MRNEVVNMTPQLASMYLEMNIDNRNIRPRAVKAMAEAIKRGEWKLTPQGIVISKSMRLLDGQHRLSAINQSGVSVPMVVWHEADDDIFDCVDRGIPRTTSDLTRLPERQVQILNLIHTLNISTTSLKPTPAQIVKLSDVFGESCNRLNDFAPRATKGFSSAGVRCAVVVLLNELGDDEDQNRVLQLYRQLTLLDFDGIPDITKTFVKQVLTGSTLKGRNGGGSEQIVAFLKALIALDPRCHSKKQLMLNESSRDEARKRIHRIIASHSHF